MSSIHSFRGSESSPQPEVVRKGDITQSWTLRSLLDLLLSSRRSTKLTISDAPPIIADKLDVPLHEFLKKNRFLVPLVQEFARVKFVVKQEISPMRFKLLFDGRFLSADLSPVFLPFSGNQPTWHLVLNTNGGVERCLKKAGGFPKSHTLPPSTVKTSFGELVWGKEEALLRGCDGLKKDPQSQQETVALLREWGLSGAVNVDFCVATLPVPVPICWIFADNREPGAPVGSDVIHLEAFTASQNRIRFRKAVGHSAEKKKPENYWLLQNKKSKKETCSSEANRASGTTVHLCGLSLALKLGMLSVFKGETGEETFLRLASELRKAFVYLWLQRDPLGRVRFVTLLDGYAPHPTSFEICPGALHPSEFGRWGERRIFEENAVREERRWQSWKKLFDFVWKTRELCQSRKLKATLPLFERWGPAKENTGGTHGKCFASVRASLSKLRVFCFSRDDSSIHSLKLFFARYCEEVRNLRRGVNLRTVTGTKILSLQTSEVEVENVSQFLDFSGGTGQTVAAARAPPQLLLNDPDADSLLRASKDWCPSLVADPWFHTNKIIGGFFDGGEMLEELCKADLERRGSALVRRLSATHLAFCDYLCLRFSLDLSTASFLTLSSVSYRAVMLDFWKQAGPTAQSLEKSKPHWEDKLRGLCKGGFSFSCRDTVSSGVKMLPEKDSERAFSVAEFDLKSCYGYSLKNMSVPGAFAVGYTFCPSAAASVESTKSTRRGAEDAKHLFSLKRTDVWNRASCFEYLGVQAVIRSSVANFVGTEVLGVWSNFSPLGVLYFGKYPVDLAVVFEGKGLFLFQFDGQFVHGCPTGNCPSLPSYAGGEDEKTVLEATKVRDAFFHNWIKDNNFRGRKLAAFYNVINDCHHPNFGYRNLKKIEELWELRKPYESLPKHSLSFPSDLLSADPELAFLLIGRGAVPQNRREGEMPLFVWRDVPAAAGSASCKVQHFGWELEEQDYLFTRDSFQHLVQVKGFEFSAVSDVYFYKKCKVLPLVFGGLVDEREISELMGNETRASFLKAAVNFTTGMFGMKARDVHRCSKARLVSRFYKKTWECLERIDVKAAGSASGREFYVFRRLAPARKTGKRAVQFQATAQRRKATDAALPIYASVVEFGKLRLLNCLEFLRAHIRIDAVRILYSQVDNLVLAMSGACLEEAVLSEKREKFEREKHNFFGPEPGKLVEKWRVGAEEGYSWSFASARICSYGLISKDGEGKLWGEQKKMSGLTGISALESFESNSRLLAGLPGLPFTQERRVNRLLNQETATKIVCARPLPPKK